MPTPEMIVNMYMMPTPEQQKEAHECVRTGDRAGGKWDGVPACRLIKYSSGSSDAAGCRTWYAMQIKLNNIMIMSWMLNQHLPAVSKMHLMMLMEGHVEIAWTWVVRALVHVIVRRKRRGWLFCKGS